MTASRPEAPASPPGVGPDPGRLRRRLLAAAAVVLSVAACGGTGSTDPGTGEDPDAAPAAVSVPEVQGARHVSPLRGEEVETEGVVTAVAPGGVHLQDAEGDGRVATSDAVLVTSVPSGAARAGQRLRVTGTVIDGVGGTEGAGLPVTRIRASDVEVLAADVPLPPPVRLGTDGRIPPQVEVIGDDELPVDLGDPRQARENPFDPDTEGLDFWESLEGMRVTVASPVAVSPGRSADPGTDVFTLVEDGAHVTPDGARTARGGLLLQPHPDNRGDQNPERVLLSFRPSLAPGGVPDLTVGDRLSDVTGVVAYGDGSFRVLATGGTEVEPGGLRPGSADPAAGDRLTVAVYNVLNMNPLPDTDDRRARLGAQIAGPLGGPALVALQEIQDRNGTRGGPDDTETDAAATLRAVADAVAAAGGPRYEFVDVAPAPNSSGGVPGGNIRNAYLYDPGRVSLVEARSLTSEELEAAGAPDPGAFDGARDPLAATFAVDGDTLTLVNVHFTSRAGSTPVFGAVHPFVQAGEEEREAQSRALHAWVADRLGTDPDARVAVVGDFNTFEFTDDLTRLLPAGGDGSAVLHNLVRTLAPERRYSYVFRGNAQALDHFFVTESLRPGAGLEIVHLNAEFPRAEGAGGVTSASGHDPLLGRLQLTD